VKIGQSAGKSFAYLFGVFLGDGCVSKNRYHCFRLNTIDHDFALATQSALSEVTDYKVTIAKHDVKGGRPNHALYCGDPDLGKFLLLMTNEKVKLPDFMWDATRDEKLAFIAGLMDSEGFVAANSNPTNRRFYMGFKSTDVWVPDFIRLLASVGIQVGKVSQETPLKPGYKTPTRFTIKMKSWVDSGAKFNIARKQSRIDAWCAAGAYENRSKFPRRLSSETNMQGAPPAME
jgi:hypothetical protein